MNAVLNVLFSRFGHALAERWYGFAMVRMRLLFEQPSPTFLGFLKLCFSEVMRQPGLRRFKAVSAPTWSQFDD